MSSQVATPKVSFLVPCYNYAAFLPHCVESILTQTYTDFELLILDDASTDSTAQIAVELCQRDARIHYRRHESNVGHLLNYNDGIERSRGELIWLISADDALASPDVLRGFVDQFESHSKLGFAFSRVQCIDGDGTPYEKFIPNPSNTNLPTTATYFAGQELFPLLTQGNFVPAPSTIARKACYDQYGLFHSELPHSGDWYNWLLFCLDWDVWYEPDAQVYYRKHQNNMHMKYQKPRHAVENTLLCLQEIERYLERHGYSSHLRRQCRKARIQYMHKQGFPMDFTEKLERLADKFNVPLSI